MKEESFKTFYDLRDYIFDRKTGKIYHYTSYESLIMILKNRTLRLSRYDLMNDITEKKLSKCPDGDCRYIISFTGTSTENVAMWALYGKHSSLKLRLEFNRNSLIESVNRNFYYDPKRNNKIPVSDTESIPSDYSKKDFTLSDVVYYDRKKNLFKYLGRSLKYIEVRQDYIDQLAGSIKYDAWEYEKESRLSVVLHKSYSSIDFANLTHIYAGLEEDFIKGLTITYSPWISDEVFDELKSSIDLLAGMTLKHQHSTLKGEITEL